MAGLCSRVQPAGRSAPSAGEPLTTLVYTFAFAPVPAATTCCRQLHAESAARPPTAVAGGCPGRMGVLTPAGGGAHVAGLGWYNVS